MLPESLLTSVQQLLDRHTGQATNIISSRPVGGGCINEAFRLETTAGAFFMKYNDARRYPGMFAAEARGLDILRENLSTGHHSLHVPKVAGHQSHGQYSMLVLEYIGSGNRQTDFWTSFGQGLAELHRCTHDAFGLDHDNYIGSLPQTNHPHKSWEEFFVEERLEIQYKLARDTGRAGRDLGAQMQALYRKLHNFFPPEPPALLHGDLWSGNFMVDDQGKAAVVDPAVYYGHRYMDLGMSRLFGGFSPDFYQAYHAAYPLEKNWHEGTDVANLYPLMVHVNLFGGSYVHTVQRLLKKFS